MNLDTPRCARCEGRRFFHVRNVVDAIPHPYRWTTRPVGVLVKDGEAQPTGHFETLVCRGCGLTTWYAFGWAELIARRVPAPCVECKDATPHARMPAVENTSSGFEQPRVTHGLLGFEGFLHTSTCTRCDRTEWTATDYAHLEKRAFVRYQVVDEPERPCLACGAVEALLHEGVLEYDHIQVPVALVERKLLGFLHTEKLVGHFDFRLCRPCGAVEWYARELDKLKEDGKAGIRALGDERERASAGGPYR